jgi:hypothetical protein
MRDGGTTFHEAILPLPLGNGWHPRKPQRLFTRTVAVTDFVGSATEVAVTPTDPDGTASGAAYVALAIVAFVTLPHADTPPVHPVMLQLTPFAAGSLPTVTENSWLPPVTTLTVGGEIVTEIGSAVGSVPQPQATASPRRPKAVPRMLVECLMRRASRYDSIATLSRIVRPLPFTPSIAGDPHAVLR